MYTKRLEITTIIGCINSCKVCPQKVLKKAYFERSACRALPFETFKQCLRSVPTDVLIEFCGMSEPFGNPDCADMVLYAHERGFRVSMYTTAVGMRLEDVQKIGAVPFVTFNLHLPDLEGNLQLKMTEAYLAVLAEIRRTGISGLDSMSLGRADDVVRRVLGDASHYPQEVFRLKSRAGNVAHMPLLYKTGRILCLRSPRLRRWVLLPSGDVLLCCMDYGMKHVIGNLTRQTYQAIATSPELKRIRRRMKDEKAGEIICRRCEIAGRPISHLHNLYNLLVARMRAFPTLADSSSGP